MKLCVNARQETEYIDLADELFFEYRDSSAIPNFMEKYPEKTMIIQCIEQDIDWDTLKTYSVLHDDRLICKIYNINYAEICKELGLKFYFGYTINSYDELNAVLNMGCEYVRLGSSLFFDMDNMHRFYPNAKIRLIPNVSYSDLYKREDGIVGTWIRPEDLQMYQDYAETVEFENVDLPQERALVRIYWLERFWPGTLDLIIPDIESDAINSMISSDITEKRLNCQQICKRNNNCHICERALDLANLDLIQNYKESVVPKYEAPKNED